MKKRKFLYIYLFILLIIAVILYRGYDSSREFKTDVKGKKSLVSESNYVASCDEAEEIYNCGYYLYSKISENEVIIIKYSGNDVLLCIPENLEGYMVKEIGTGAFEESQISEVIIPDGVKKIDEGAFRNCKSLYNVVFGSELEYVGKQAFAGCDMLEVILFPEGVKEIDAEALMNCRALYKIYLPCSIEWLDKSVLVGDDGLCEVWGENELARDLADNIGAVYVDRDRVREEGNQVW